MHLRQALRAEVGLWFICCCLMQVAYNDPLLPVGSTLFVSTLQSRCVMMYTSHVVPHYTSGHEAELKLTVYWSHDSWSFPVQPSEHQQRVLETAVTNWAVMPVFKGAKTLLAGNLKGSGGKTLATGQLAIVKDYKKVTVCVKKYGCQPYVVVIV